MDPNEALRRCRNNGRELRKHLDSRDEVSWATGNGLMAADALQLAFADLDSWLVRGGFLPKDWEKAGGGK